MTTTIRMSSIVRTATMIIFRGAGYATWMTIATTPKTRDIAKVTTTTPGTMETMDGSNDEAAGKGNSDIHYISRLLVKGYITN